MPFHAEKKKKISRIKSSTPSLFLKTSSFLVENSNPLPLSQKIWIFQRGHTIIENRGLNHFRKAYTIFKPLFSPPSKTNSHCLKHDGCVESEWGMEEAKGRKLKVRPILLTLAVNKWYFFLLLNNDHIWFINAISYSNFKPWI